MKKITLLAPAAEKPNILEWLYRQGEVHLSGESSESGEWIERFRPIELEGNLSSAAAEREVTLLKAAQEFLRQFLPAKGSFLDGIFSAKRVIEKEKFQTIISTVNSASISGVIEELHTKYARNTEARKSLTTEKESLLPFVSLSVPPIRLKATKWVGLALFRARPPVFTAIAKDEKIRDYFEVALSEQSETEVLFWLAFPLQRAQEATSAIARYTAKEVPLISISDAPSAAIARIDARLSELAQEEQEILNQILAHKELADKIDVAIAYYESEVRRTNLARQISSSERILICRGYIRKRQAGKFLRDLKKEFPSVSAELEDPAPGENVPVLIRLNPLLRPMQLLVNMFGLPNYWTFDPTAFVTFTFLIFFGICFGDVLYGAMLIVLATLFERRYRDLPGLHGFFRLFLYAGISTIIFGALTGSLAADFVDRWFLDAIGLGSIAAPLRAVKAFSFDALKFPLVALGIALGIGILNQLYGIFMRLVRDLSMGRPLNALFDGATWLTYLPGLILFAVGSLASPPLPAWLSKLGLIMTIIGAVSLVLTQGRDQKGFAGKAIVGLVSLYGIMGTYGTASFVGDVLSYSRLLALAMTTTIVGMAFNIIAALAPDIIAQIFPAFLVTPLAIIAVPVILVGGHIFNFAMSILTAFIHSARLIFLEFFSRFYESGGVKFAPFGFVSNRVELKS
jgi:V/A-type H+-transporting ATPase subunit I